MGKYLSAYPDLKTRVAMSEVILSLQNVARVANREEVVSLAVERCLRVWVDVFDPKQGPCFLVGESHVYAAAVSVLLCFVKELDPNREDLTLRIEVTNQVARFDFLRVECG